MFNLTSFTKLDISNYKLQNFSISKLDILREMNLSNNNLTFYELSESPNVSIIDLSRNRFNKVEHFCNLQNLTKLNLSHNRLTNLEELNQSVTSLVFLDVSNNKFETFILRLAPNLSELNFSDNNL